MFTARALRCAHATPFARRAALHPPYLQASIRLNSSSAIDTANEQSTQDERQTDAPQQEEVERRVPETPGLDAILGVENMNKARRLHFEIKRLAHELDRIYGRQRIIRKVSPYRVRIGATPFAFNKRAESETHPEVRDGKMFLVDRLIPSIWLRDNCQCKVCTHDATKQRLLDTFSIPEDISIKSHSAETRGSETVHRIEWSDGHESEYSGPFLSQAINNARLKAVQRQALVNIKPWDSSIASDPPKTLYANAMNPNNNDLLFRLRRFGFCYVDETPFENPEATKKMLEKIAFIRETHYGGFYDFTADLASKDTAYTNIALEAHTDTTYFSDPAGLQAFHLLSHTDGEGGASLLVDGFKAADELWHTDRKAYEILSTVNVHGHASGNEGISIQPYRGFPVLEHDTATGDLLRVRWNTSDRASIELPIEEVETWYDAARKFDAILKKKENEYWEQLVPGRVLIFDNWRVLHGRSSFTGKRRICGAYINRDDWISKFKMRHFGKENVLKGLAVN